MDELDSFGMKDTSGHHQHTLQEVNGVLRMFDDIHDKNLNIVLIGITNYPALLDQALVRVGRFAEVPGRRPRQPRRETARCSG